MVLCVMCCVILITAHLNMTLNSILQVDEYLLESLQIKPDSKTSTNKWQTKHSSCLPSLLYLVLEALLAGDVQMSFSLSLCIVGINQ